MEARVDRVDDLKRRIATAHRILTKTGSMGDITGHVIARAPGADWMLVRCRSFDDVSPALVQDNAIFQCDLDGNALEALGDYSLPPERFIGAEVFRARDDVNAVVHGHPPAQIMCGITGVEIRPILGSANLGGMFLARDGIPVFPRSVLIATPSLGRQVAETMAARNVALLKGHGNVVAGLTIEEATVRAIQIENLARVCWDVAAAGKHADDVSAEDLNEFEDLREFLEPSQARVTDMGTIGVTTSTWMWNHYERALRENLSLYAEMGCAL
jgi:3,4-dihydroxyphthalate decarboxylase